jgi:hypothetical protein
VQVLDYEHRRPALGDLLQEPSPRGERLLSGVTRGGLQPEQGTQPLAEPLSILSFGQDPVELGRGDLRRVGLEDPGVGLDDLP